MNAQTTIAPTRDDRLFTAVMMPLTGPNGETLSDDIGRAVVRDDTGETIAVAGSGFKPVQHRDVVGPVIEHFESHGYKLEERPKNRRDLYDLQGKKGAFINPVFDHNGAVMRTDIITGDFIQPTGASSYLDDGADTMLFKISIFNSHNSSLAVRVVTSYERLICLNGMTRPDFSAGVYGKHTTGFNIRAMQAKIENALHAMEDDAETFGLWAKTRITYDQASDMLKKTIAKAQNRDPSKPQFSEQLVTKIMGQFLREDQTVWGLYQAVTHWQTHGERKANASVIGTTIGREKRVAAMLNTADWRALVD